MSIRSGDGIFRRVDNDSLGPGLGGRGAGPVGAGGVLRTGWRMTGTGTELQSISGGGVCLVLTGSGSCSGRCCSLKGDGSTGEGGQEILEGGQQTLGDETDADRISKWFSSTHESIDSAAAFLFSLSFPFEKDGDRGRRRKDGAEKECVLRKNDVEPALDEYGLPGTGKAENVRSLS